MISSFAKRIKPSTLVRRVYELRFKGCSSRLRARARQIDVFYNVVVGVSPKGELYVSFEVWLGLAIGFLCRGVLGPVRHDNGSVNPQHSVASRPSRKSIFENLLPKLRRKLREDRELGEWLIQGSRVGSLVVGIHSSTVRPVVHHVCRRCSRNCCVCFA
jgi:hypothetical protein